MGRIGSLFFSFEYFYDYEYDNCLYTDGSYVHKKDQSGIMLSKTKKIKAAVIKIKSNEMTKIINKLMVLRRWHCIYCGEKLIRPLSKDFSSQRCTGHEYIITNQFFNV